MPALLFPVHLMLHCSVSDNHCQVLVLQATQLLKKASGLETTSVGHRVRANLPPGRNAVTADVKVEGESHHKLPRMHAQ